MVEGESEVERVEMSKKSTKHTNAVIYSTLSAILLAIPHTSLFNQLPDIVRQRLNHQRSVSQSDK